MLQRREDIVICRASMRTSTGVELVHNQTYLWPIENQKRGGVVGCVCVSAIFRMVHVVSNNSTHRQCFCMYL